MQQRAVVTTGATPPTAIGRAAALSVRTLSEADHATWERYIVQHGDATLFHSLKWKRVIEKAFGYRSNYLLVERDGEITGVLPLFFVSNFLCGSAVISSPFAVYGGICATDSQAQELLLTHAFRITRENQSEYLELRQRKEIHHEQLHGKDLYVSFDRELGSDPFQLFNSLPKDTRYEIRKAQRHGLTITAGNEQLELFHELYAHHTRRLGTPVFSIDFFRCLREEFSDALQINVAAYGPTPVAALLSFRFREWVLPYYIAVIPKARDLAASYLLYWELMRKSCEEGIRYFDFGRSKLGTGAYFFKSHWKMCEHHLPYRYYLVNRASVPNYSPANGRFRLALEAWKRLPLSLTKALGPRLVRLFP